MHEILNNLGFEWSFLAPTKIVFGNGCVNRIAEAVSQFGQSTLIVTGQSAIRNGLYDLCLNLLKHANIKAVGYNSVTSDPTVHQVNSISTMVGERGIQSIVGLGGGSVIDAAKASSVVAKYGGRIQDYLSTGEPIETNTIPVIAVPTTAGTGSELSKGAIITWPEKNLKRGIRGVGIFPRLALVDPSLTIPLSPQNTMITGFDAFSHGVETYVSRRATPLTTTFSEMAIRSVTKYLPVAVKEPENIEARTVMSFYSMLMGFNLGNSSTCLPHRLQYPIGALTKSPHGVGLAALYPRWVEVTQDSSPEKFDKIRTWMKIGLGSITGGISSISQCLKVFLQRVGLSPSLEGLGVDDKLRKQIIKMVEGNLLDDPWWNEDRDLMELLT